MEKLSNQKYSVRLSQRKDTQFDPFDPISIEQRVANSSGLIVLLTKDCLKKREVLFPLQCAKHYYKEQISRVFLVLLNLIGEIQLKINLNQLNEKLEKLFSIF